MIAAPGEKGAAIGVPAIGQVVAAERHDEQAEPCHASPGDEGAQNEAGDPLPEARGPPSAYIVGPAVGAADPHGAGSAYAAINLVPQSTQKR